MVYDWAVAAQEALHNVENAENVLRADTERTMTTFQQRASNTQWRKETGNGWQKVADNEKRRNLKVDVERYSDRVRPLLEEVCNHLDKGTREGQRLRMEAESKWIVTRDKMLNGAGNNPGLFEYVSRRLKLLGDAEIVAWCGERVLFRVLLWALAELELLERVKVASSIGTAMALADVRALQAGEGAHLLKKADEIDALVASCTARMQECARRVESIERANANEKQLGALLYGAQQAKVA